jgi:16S rRNA (cytosine1402-N4)-methyltransferase
MMNYVHATVMLEETLHFLSPTVKNELVLDATTGEGGLSYALLSKYPDIKLVCIDADKDILEIAKKRLQEFEDRVFFHNGWAHEFLTDYPSELKRPDKIIIDLGISNYHYKKSGKGYTFEKDEYLDMRLDTSEGLTAADIVARFPEKELADLIYNNSDERYSRRIAAQIVNARQNSPITTTLALAELVKKAVPASYRHGRIHPATKTFLALRVAVNGELLKLPVLLEAALKILEPGGRFAVISFSSLEDRHVKTFFKRMNQNCICPQNVPKCICEGFRSVNLLTKKGITPGKEEIERNPPSRSARLRVLEKILDGDNND